MSVPFGQTRTSQISAVFCRYTRVLGISHGKDLHFGVQGQLPHLHQSVKFLPKLRRSPEVRDSYFSSYRVGFLKPDMVVSEDEDLELHIFFLSSAILPTRLDVVGEVHQPSKAIVKGFPR